MTVTRLGDNVGRPVVVAQVVRGQRSERPDELERHADHLGALVEHLGQPVDAVDPDRPLPGQMVQADVVELDALGFDAEGLGEVALEADRHVAQADRTVALVEQRLGDDADRVREVDDPGARRRAPIRRRRELEDDRDGPESLGEPACPRRLLAHQAEPAGDRLVPKSSGLTADPQLDEDEVGAVERRIPVQGLGESTAPALAGEHPTGHAGDDAEPLRIAVEEHELVDRQTGRPCRDAFDQLGGVGAAASDDHDPHADLRPQIDNRATTRHLAYNVSSNRVPSRPLRHEAHVVRYRLESGPVPLHHQVYLDLRTALEAGEWRPGDQLPPERELAGRYGCSLITVRRALTELTREHRLERTRGRGTFVTRPPIELELDGAMSFTEEMQVRGRDPQTRVVSSRTKPADPPVAAALGLPAEAPVFYLERLRLADGEPLLLEEVCLSADRFPGLLAADLEANSLYDLLTTRYATRVVRAREWLEPIALPRREARLLGVRAGKPALLVEGIGFDQAGSPVEYARSYVRGDRTRYFVERVVVRSTWLGVDERPVDDRPADIDARTAVLAARR